MFPFPYAQDKQKTTRVFYLFCAQRGQNSVNENRTVIPAAELQDALIDLHPQDFAVYVDEVTCIPNHYSLAIHILIAFEAAQDFGECLRDSRRLQNRLQKIAEDCKVDCQLHCARD